MAEIRWERGWDVHVEHLAMPHVQQAARTVVTTARAMAASRVTVKSHANAIDSSQPIKDPDGWVVLVGFQARHPGWYLAFDETGTTRRAPNPILPRALRTAF